LTLRAVFPVSTPPVLRAQNVISPMKNGRKLNPPAGDANAMSVNLKVNGARRTVATEPQVFAHATGKRIYDPLHPEWMKATLA
jgi:hypothetical protein